MKKHIVIYQTKHGGLELQGDLQKETLWASLQQIADLFDIDKSGISRHIKNIYKTKELDPKSTVAKIATVQKEGQREIKRYIEYYNLDLILSVGYRVNSQTATKFRQWATKTLSKHIIKGYTINRKRIVENYEEFLRAVESVQKLLPEVSDIKAKDTLAIIKLFANTWFSLDAYDKADLPTAGVNKKQIKITANELLQAILVLKEELIKQKEASNIFAIEKQKNAIEGIVGNIFQTVDKKEVYPTVEDKASHLLYFMIKDHPFVDGNKRIGAFVFIWFLRKAGLLNKTISPQALTALTLLIAESEPKNKEQMIGLILQLLMK